MRAGLLRTLSKSARSAVIVIFTPFIDEGAQYLRKRIVRNIHICETVDKSRHFTESLSRGNLVHMTSDSIENLSSENRTFAPSADFAALANGKADLDTVALPEGQGLGRADGEDRPLRGDDRVFLVF